MKATAALEHLAWNSIVFGAELLFARFPGAAGASGHAFGTNRLTSSAASQIIHPNE